MLLKFLINELERYTNIKIDILKFDAPFERVKTHLPKVTFWLYIYILYEILVYIRNKLTR